MNALVLLFLVSCAAAHPGVYVPTVEILQGPSNKADIIGPDGSIISAYIPGGQIITESDLSDVTAYVEQGSPIVNIHGPKTLTENIDDPVVTDEHLEPVVSVNDLLTKTDIVGDKEASTIAPKENVVTTTLAPTTEVVKNKPSQVSHVPKKSESHAETEKKSNSSLTESPLVKQLEERLANEKPVAHDNSGNSDEHDSDEIEEYPKEYDYWTYKGDGEYDHDYSRVVYEF